MTTHAKGVYAPLPDTPQLESPPEATSIVYQDEIKEYAKNTTGSDNCDLWSVASSSGYLSVGSDHALADPGLHFTTHATTLDSDSDWEEEEWPLTRPLPLPEWGCERPKLKFDTLKGFQEFLAEVQTHVEDNISNFNYDTFSNFIMFSREYEGRKDKKLSMKDFYRDYDPPMLPGRYTCVGLSLDLMTRMSYLEKSFPGFKDSMFQVSCEEDVEFLDCYCKCPYPPTARCDKDHVLVCIKISIKERDGIILLDSGYHVSKPIVVMEDGAYPHTQPFVAQRKDNSSKVFSYNFCDDNFSYILWEYKEYREGKVIKNQYNLIHVTRPYMSAIDFAERRNLTYSLKSLISRNRDGQLEAGVYFRVSATEDCKVTLFYKIQGQGGIAKTQTCKVPLAYFLYPPVISPSCDNSPDKGWLLNPTWENSLTLIEDITGNTHDLRATLSYIANVLNQPDFLRQLLDIDESINQLSIFN